MKHTEILTEEINDNIERVETTNDNTKTLVIRFSVLFGIAFCIEIVLFALGLIPALMFWLCTGSFFMGYVICFSGVKGSKFKILFKNNEIIVDDLKRFRHFNLYNLNRNDFVMRQTGRQKKLNRGYLRIDSKKLTFADMENFAEVKAHIEKYFL